MSTTTRRTAAELAALLVDEHRPALDAMTPTAVAELVAGLRAVAASPVATAREDRYAAALIETARLIEARPSVRSG